MAIALAPMECNARNTVDYLRQWEMAPLTLEKDRIPAADKEKLLKAMTNVRLSFEAFTNVVEPMREAAPRYMYLLYGLVTEMISAAAVRGGGLFAPNARKFYEAPHKEEKRKAGEESGKSRREKRYWVKPFEDLVVTIQAEKPHLSQDDLATEEDQERPSRS